MKNKHAILLNDATIKYYAWFSNAFRGDSTTIKGCNKDLRDLKKITSMIESNEDKNKIARAMWSLDTAVREVIPDEVYYAYTEL